MKEFSFLEALSFARDYAEKGLQLYPYDAIYRTALDKVELIERALEEGKTIADMPINPDIGLMAAKSLGVDDNEFAQALSVIQYDIERAHGSG